MNIENDRLDTSFSQLRTSAVLIHEQAKFTKHPCQKSGPFSIWTNRFPPFVRPKTCYCQKQSSKYAIFPCQARDQSFTRVPEMIRNTGRHWTQQTLPVDRAKLFLHKAQRCLPENVAQGSQNKCKTTHCESRVQYNTRADFQPTYTERIMASYEKKIFFGGGGID